MTAAGAPFDLGRLRRHLGERLPGFAGEIAVERLAGGKSNPTFRLRTPEGDYVLRKKPVGKLLPSAHAIDREFAVMRALEGHAPVPRMRLYCDDAGVIGEPFYVMDHVEGRIMPDARLLDAPPDERAALSFELARVLGGLHRLDYRALGLEGFGRPDAYVARQLARWSKQYAASRVEENRDMDRVIPWLEAGLPDDDEVSIVHGDYRSYNVIFAPDAPRIAAVLDWELATIGHPLADLAYCLLPYHLPAEDPRGFRGEDPAALGIPSEEALTQVYAEAAGRSPPKDLNYFLVFALFRSAAIRAGVYRRVLDGVATDTTAEDARLSYRGAAAHAWELAAASSG